MRRSTDPIPLDHRSFRQLPELYFFGKRAAGRQRVDGRLAAVVLGKSWEACSGSRSLRPLPNGVYDCSNFRDRSKVAMTRGGVGFSVDLDPTFPTHRSLLRILQ